MAMAAFTVDTCQDTPPTDTVNLFTDDSITLATSGIRMKTIAFFLTLLLAADAYVQSKICVWLINC